MQNPWPDLQGQGDIIINIKWMKVSSLDINDVLYKYEDNLFRIKEVITYLNLEGQYHLWMKVCSTWKQTP